MKIALIQMNVCENKEKNLIHAGELISEAKTKGAIMAVLPEMFVCPYDNACFASFSEEKNGKIYNFLSETARKNEIYVVGGSFPEKEGDRLFNTSIVFNPLGNEIASHRKTHLFDIDIEGGQSFRESDTFSPGNGGTFFEADGHKFGLAICFDIRFAEMFRELAVKGAEAMIVPAAFNMTTGPMHWEITFRMRALDNQVYTLGCAPARNTGSTYVSYANSIVCDPWGSVKARAGFEEELLIADIDFDEIERARNQIPIMKEYLNE